MGVDKPDRYMIKIETYAEGTNTFGYADGWRVIKLSTFEVKKEVAEEIKKKLQELEKDE